MEAGEKEAAVVWSGDWAMEPASAGFSMRPWDKGSGAAKRVWVAAARTPLETPMRGRGALGSQINTRATWALLDTHTHFSSL